MSAQQMSDILILGAGPAGYTAAVYAARANRSPTLVAGLQPGGQLTITTDVENYPGFAAAIQGPWLMEQMRDQAANVGTTIINDIITAVDFSASPFTCIGETGTAYKAKSVIIATGAQARWLGLESEKKYQGFGVSACATCDGFFYRNQTVAVVGGGNSAVEEALYLTNHAEKVILIHRRDRLRAEKILQDRLMKHPKIDIIWHSVVEEIIGQDMPPSVKAVRLRSTLDGTYSEIEVSGVFVAIGHDPSTALFKGHLQLDEDNYIIKKPDSTQTSVAGIFAAGDVTDKIFRQAVTAAGMGCMAALEAEKYLVDQA